MTCNLASNLFLQMIGLFSSQKTPLIYLQVINGVFFIGTSESYFEVLLPDGTENSSLIRISTQELLKCKSLKKKDVNADILLVLEERVLKITLSNTLTLLEPVEVIEGSIFEPKQSLLFNIGDTSKFFQNFYLPTSVLKVPKVVVLQNYLYWITDTLVARIPFFSQENLTFSFDVTGLAANFLRMFSSCYISLEEVPTLFLESDEGYRYIRCFKKLTSWENFSQELVTKLTSGFSEGLIINDISSLIASCKQAKPFTDPIYQLLELSFPEEGSGILSLGSTEDSFTPEFNFSFEFCEAPAFIQVCLSLSTFLKILEIFKKDSGIQVKFSDKRVLFTGMDSFIEIFGIPYDVLEET